MQGGCLSSALNLEEGKSRQRVLSDGENRSQYSQKLAVRGAIGSRQRQEETGASHLRQWGLFSRRVFHSKEVRVLTSGPLVVSEGCRQVPGTSRHLEAP